MKPSIWFLKLVESCFKLIEATFVGYGESVYKQAAMFMAMMAEDDTIYRQVRSQFILTRDEWVSQAHQVDYSGLFKKKARKLAYENVKKRGMVISNGLPVGVERDAWEAYVEKLKIKLMAKHEKVKKLFHYMPGIGFVVKGDDWFKVAHRLRAQQIALAALGCDTENLSMEHTALFEVSSTRTHVFTETMMELATFDREGQTTDDRLARAYNQPGHEFFRGREEDAGYDGDGGILAAHDMNPDAVEENKLCGKLGIRARVKHVILMDLNLNRLTFIQKDTQFKMVKSENGEYMLDRKYVQDLIQMGPQRKWIDKVQDPRDPSWKTLHNPRFVHDPAALKLYAYRALNDPDNPLPSARQAFEDFGSEHCILDIENTKYYRDKNPYVFGVSKRFNDRMGSFRYVVIWYYKKEEGGKRSYPYPPQVFKVNHANAWGFCVNYEKPVVLKYDERMAEFVGIGIAGQQAHDVLDLMGIKWTSQLLKLTNEHGDLIGVKDNVTYYPKYVRISSKKFNL